MRYRIYQADSEKFTIVDVYGCAGKNDIYGQEVITFNTKQEAQEWMLENQKGESCNCYGHGYEKVKFKGKIYIHHCPVCAIHESDEEAYEHACKFEWDVYMQEQNKYAKGFIIHSYAGQTGIKKISFCK